MSENRLMDLKKTNDKADWTFRQRKYYYRCKCNDLVSKTFDELVILLRDTLKEEYPKTKLKRIMKSVHYANGF